MLNRIAAEAAAQHGDRPAVMTPAGWTASFAELHRLSDEAAVGFGKLDIGEGDVVALCLPSSVEYIVAYLGLAKVGAVIAGVNPLLSAEERAKVLDRSGATSVLASAGLIDVDGLPAGDGLQVIEVQLADRLDHVLAGIRVAGGVPPALLDDPERPVVVVFTSGTTTGVPKGALFRNRQLQAAVEVEDADPWCANEHILSGTQFAHVGFMLRLAPYLRQGTTLCMVDKWRAETAMQLIERHHMPAVNGVAAQVALVLDHPDIDRYDLSSIRRIVVGGGPSSPALITAAIERWGAVYSIRYSSTESGGVGTATSYTEPVTTSSTNVGSPRGDVQLRIELAGRACEVGEVGEICIRSSAMLSEYWRDPAATAAALADGWLHTGDLGYIDDNGDLNLAGRTTEMYIRGGYNVYPQEVEAVLSRHPSVVAIAVVGRPDDVMGEVGVAVVVAKQDAPTLAELREFGTGHMAGFKLPEVLRIVDELPLTQAQKLDRRRLSALIAVPSDDEERLRN